MRHVLDDPSGLSARVVRFLAEAGERAPFDGTAGTDAEEIRSLPMFQRAAARYGGLRYRSVAWSFEQTITFDPVPWTAEDYGPEDRDAMADLIVYDLAHPGATWLRGDGAVISGFPGPGSAPAVPIYPSVDMMLEAEGLYRDCATWKPVPLDDAPDLPAIEAHRQGLTRIPEAYGFTERWWEQDGFRLHIWKTSGFGVRWAVWARDRSGERAARSFLDRARPTS